MMSLLKVLTIFCLLPVAWAWTMTGHGSERRKSSSCRQATRSGNDVLKNTTPQLYLFSLEWTPDERISKPVRDVWKWKDVILGDGRDFFVPKPKTISALQEYLLQNAPIVECSVISNCARMEILCSTTTTTRTGETVDLLPQLCQCLVAQRISQPSRPMFQVLTQGMDWPETVMDLQAPVSESEESLELARHWVCHEGAQDILYHLSLVAAGMASRPRRPDRQAIFRPFSSRDAHILLQLKRTKEVAVGTQVNQLVEFALRAGKAARNVDKVPELKLLQRYGTGDSKYSTEPPTELMQQVAQAAIEKAINPLVKELLQNMQAQQSSSVIGNLRREAEAFAKDKAELQIVRKRLHQPTLKLRQGQSVNVQETLQEIQQELDTLQI